jgi:hypothetical protein
MDLLSLTLLLSGITILYQLVIFELERRKISTGTHSQKPFPEDNKVLASKMNLATPKIHVRSYEPEDKPRTNNLILVETPEVYKRVPEQNKENFIHHQLKCTLDYTPSLSSRVNS